MSWYGLSNGEKLLFVCLMEHRCTLENFGGRGGGLKSFVLVKDVWIIHVDNIQKIWSLKSQ